MGSNIWGVDETFLKIMFLEIILVSDIVESWEEHTLQSLIVQILKLHGPVFRGYFCSF